MGEVALQEKNNVNKDKALVFSDTAQIREILSEMSQLKLPVLIKYSLEGKSVRGFVETLEPGTNRVRIAGISNEGDKLLQDHTVLRIEFSLMAMKLVFIANVLAHAQNRLLLSSPMRLVAIERRSNSRFPVPLECAAFIEFPEIPLDLHRLDAPFPPVFGKRRQTGAARMRVDDVSLGGLACFTRFFATAEALKPRESETTAKLYFPNMSPFFVPVSVRWTKKTISSVAAGTYAELENILSKRAKEGHDLSEFNFKETFYRIGVQFPEVSKEVDSFLRNFIRVIQDANSV